MVSLPIIQSSNDQIKSTLPAGLVAVFVGATNGVGETTVRQFAQHAAQPRVYIVGRSREAGNRIAAECKTINPGGTFVFLQRDDISLMHEVDALCNEISSKEHIINLLFLTIGTLQIGTKTREGLPYSMALSIYARSRIISNLLPNVRRATNLRRVVSVYAGTFEGQINRSDFEGSTLGRMAEMGHQASIMTLDLEAHHKIAPEVSFVHAFPGAVESGIARGSIGPMMRVLKTIWGILGPLVHIPLVEAGDRHLFFGTSARFSNGSEDEAGGVPLVAGLDLAKGTDGQVGSGVYSINEHGESAKPTVVTLLARFRDEKIDEWLKEKIESDINGALASSKS